MGEVSCGLQANLRSKVQASMSFLFGSGLQNDAECTASSHKGAAGVGADEKEVGIGFADRPTDGPTESEREAGARARERREREGERIQ